MRRLSLARSPYYHYFQEDDNFRRWVESLERGSITTAAVYFRRIGFLSSQLKVVPRQMAAMNTREARDFIHDTISYLEKSGNVGSSIESYVKAVKSWLTWNDIELPKRVKVYGASETPTVENEVTPVTAELRKIFEVGTLRARAVCSMIAFGAFRPEVFGNLVADDGLTIRDLPEMRIGRVTNERGEVIDGKVSFEKVPTMVVVRKSISKVGHQYFGFLPEATSQTGCRPYFPYQQPKPSYPSWRNASLREPRYLSWG